MDMSLSVVFNLAAILLLFSNNGFCSSEQDPNYTFMNPATQAPAVSYYDYIVVGGGTAGCPLAATLSENSKVLLLERGGSPYGNNPTSSSPSSPTDPFVSEDGVRNTRARILGGGTSINAGFYSRASPAQVKAMGLDGAMANQSYEWVEKVIVFEPRIRQWQSALQDGLLEAGVKPYNGFTYDHLYGTKIGGTSFDQHGRRHTAVDLLRQYADHTQLTVLLYATVSRVIISGEPAAARGVVFQDAEGNQHTAYLNCHGGEVILSAGALGSPQLLMLSGVGPGGHLASLGIEVLVDQPLVGQGMTDNPMNGVMIPSPSPVEVSGAQQVGITHSGSYIEAVSGFDLLGALAGNSTSRQHVHINSGFMAAKVANPLSSGHLRLVSRNPNDNPAITFNYYKEPEDLVNCVEGLKIISRVIESKAFAMFKYPNATVESLLEDFARGRPNLRARHEGGGTLSLKHYCNDTVLTIWHYHGGCQVSKVVDPEYRVVGVNRLRVIDGSTFNFSPGSNPSATIMMLGRYMGLKIKKTDVWNEGLSIYTDMWWEKAFICSIKLLEQAERVVYNV